MSQGLTSPEKATLPSKDALQSTFISKEDTYYIFLECVQFASDDGIEAALINHYINTCFDELTIAVKTAKHQIQQKNITK